MLRAGPEDADEAVYGLAIAGGGAPGAAPGAQAAAFGLAWPHEPLSDTEDDGEDEREARGTRVRDDRWSLAR